MSPNSMESRLARLDAELKATASQVNAFGPIAGQVLQAIQKLDDLADEVGELKDDIEQMQRDYRDDAKARAESRRTVIIAIIAASGMVIAAIIAAAATIVSAGA